MTKYVDLLILAADAGSRPQTHFGGMRTIGSHKAAWAARQHGYTVQVISRVQIYTLEQVVKVAMPFVGPDTIIGVSTALIISTDSSNPRDANAGIYYDNQRHVQKMVDITNSLRLLYDNLVLLGGTNADAYKDMFDADHCIKGEAENSLPMLLDKIKRHGIQRKPYDWDITTCNFKWHPTDFIQQKEPLPLEMDRGCIFKCKFCQYDQTGKRRGTFEKSTEILRQELIDNYDKYKTTYYWLMADTFNDDDIRMNEFCDVLESLPFKIHFAGFTRMDLLYRFQKTARRLYENGLVGCAFGIESLHPAASNAIGKGWNGRKGKEALKHLYKNIFEENISFTMMNILGLPGEPIEHALQSVDWYLEADMGDVLYQPLGVSDPARRPNYISSSEFDRDPSKYGYSFPDPKDPIYWVNDQTNFRKCLEMADTIATRVQPNNRRHGNAWENIVHLSASGLSPKEIKRRGVDNVARETAGVALSQAKQYFADLQRYSQQKHSLTS